MKKYVFMTYHKEYDNFIHTLRDLGVVHVQERNTDFESAELQELTAMKKRVETQLDFFRKHETENLLPVQPATKDECLRIIEKIEELREKENRLTTKLSVLYKEIDNMQAWGDFDYANIEKLKESGYTVSFFTCPASRFNPQWVEDYNAVLVGNFQSVSHFVTVTKTDETIDIEAENAKIPEAGISALRAAAAQTNEEIDKIEDELRKKTLAVYNTLDDFGKSLQNEINLINVTAQTESQADDKVVILEGWTTAEQAPKMEAKLDKQRYFFQELKIEDRDKVPIELKNNSYVRLFEPITRMFSLPNYREIDPTPLFAPFFMLFFGLCFADAGYGLLVLLAATIAKSKVAADMRSICTLGQWLGGTAVVVGLLITGTFFGIELVNLPALAPVKDFFLSQERLMQLALALGMFHIVFGKTVAAYKKYKQKGFKYSISHWAWVFVLGILLLLYAPAMLSIFGAPLNPLPIPQIVKSILLGIVAVSGVAILFYNSPDKNIFFNFGLSIWNIYNAAVGLLGDTLSYIRLFAIGLAGGILGSVFNMLALDLTADAAIIVRIPAMLLILLIGHAINIGLALIASLVHPVRLIFVEYFKNSEYEGGGTAYAPFKKA